MLRKRMTVVMITSIVAMVLFSVMPAYAYYGAHNGILGIVCENGVPKEGIKVEVYREATMQLEGYGVNPDDSQGELGTDYTDINGEYHIAWLYSAGEWYIVKFYTPCEVIERRVQVFCATKTYLDICYSCEEGESPGYWKHQVKAFVEERGRLHEDIVGLTADIDLELQDPPYPWDLPPMPDVDGDGAFDIDDAYEIFRGSRTLRYLRLDLANWYNFVRGWEPY